MKRNTILVFTVLIVVAVVSSAILASNTNRFSGQARSSSTGGACSLSLVKTVLLPNTNGRIDHMDIDVAGERLFVAALGNNSLAVIDLTSDVLAQSIQNLALPQGVGFVPEAGALFVSNDGNGYVDEFNASSYRIVKATNLGSNADNIRYDAAAGRLYVGYGNGGIAAFDSMSGKMVGNIGLAGHPESFVVAKLSSRIFVNVPFPSNYVAVIDLKTSNVVATWPVVGATGAFPMALDEQDHRLFLGTRVPSQMLVIDSDSGEILARVAIPQDPDDIFYDSNTHCIYISSGGGFLSVISQISPDSYEAVNEIPTGNGARTALFSPSLNELFVAVPQSDSADARILVYRPT